MQYYSHYIWESGSEEKDNTISVALQQISQGSHHYLFACICDGGRSVSSEDKNSLNCMIGMEGRSIHGSTISGYFTERLVEWFHRQFLSQIAKRHREDYIMKALQLEITKVLGELKEYGKQKNIHMICDIQGIFLYDSQFWFFGQGRCSSYLFNRKFNRKQQKLLCTVNDDEITHLQGKIHKDIGILLCSSDFVDRLSHEEMIQVLFEDKLDDKEIRKRLREIQKENRHRGSNTCTGAVYIRLE